MSLADKVGAKIESIENGRDERLARAAAVIQARILQELAENGTSESPSHPGEAPHKITGELVRSIFVEVRNGQAYVGSRLDYAHFLEKGTLRMSPRPWLQPAIEATKDQVRKILFGG